MINEIINKKKVTNAFPKQFLINDNFETDPKNIAQQFNKYFVEIGPKLASSISNHSYDTFRKFLKNPWVDTHNSFWQTLKHIEHIDKPKLVGFACRVRRIRRAW